jgi:hypothetical protein
METEKITWLFGIEKYFHFVQDVDKKQFIRNIINLKYSDQQSKPWSLKNLISDDYKKYPENGRNNRLDFYTNVCSMDEVTTREIIYTLHSIWPDDVFIEKLLKIVHLDREDILPTIFSKSQVMSKIWMAEILSKFNLNFNNVLLIGGWLTHHSLYLKDINYSKLFSVDPDDTINDLIEIINPDAYVENKNISECFDSDNNLTFYNKILEPDLIINTSSEHMSTEWFDRLKPGTVVFIENNNYDIEEHINYSETLPDFLKKYPVTTTYYRGEITFQKYKRYALYGVK